MAVEALAQRSPSKELKMFYPCQKQLALSRGLASHLLSTLPGRGQVRLAKLARMLAPQCGSTFARLWSQNS